MGSHPQPKLPEESGLGQPPEGELTRVEVAGLWTTALALETVDLWVLRRLDQAERELLVGGDLDPVLAAAVASQETQ